MIGEFLTRLAVALPLVCLLAALFVLAVKRGWIRLPAGGRMALAMPRMRAAPPGPLRVLSVQAVAPTARVAVVQFHGREHLLAVNGQSLLLIASADMPCPVAGAGEGGEQWRG